MNGKWIWGGGYSRGQYGEDISGQNIGIMSERTMMKMCTQNFAESFTNLQ